MASLEPRYDRNTRALGWLISEYGYIERRLNLMLSYNNLAGPPSPAMTQVQTDFIKARMEPAELVAFVVMCQSLIDYVH